MTDQIYGNITLSSLNLVIDTGLSYALAPIRDLQAIVKSFELNYGIKCGLNSQATTIQYF